MRTIWTIIGVIVLIAILFWIYKRTTVIDKPYKSIYTALPSTLPMTSPKREENKTTETVIIQPIIVRNPEDCNQTYEDAVINLYDVYRQKRVIYNNGINSNDPNTIQYRKDMNDAYNAYYNEGRKCNFLPYR